MIQRRHVALEIWVHIVSVSGLLPVGTNHNLDQFWVIISTGKLRWRSSDGNFTSASNAKY